jgi:hypothetical protein
MISCTTASEQVVVLQDAGTGEFVVPPAIQPSPRREVACLSPDGTTVGLIDHGREERFGWHVLATGEERWVTVLGDQVVIGAAAFIDDRTAAVLWVAVESSSRDDAGGTVLGVLDSSTRGQRTVFSARGGLAAESAVAVSPDGRCFAISYEAPVSFDDDSETHSCTVVMDNSGQIRRMDDTWIVPPGNSAWLNSSELICHFISRDGPAAGFLTAVNAATGERHTLRSVTNFPMARSGSRLLIRQSQPYGKGPVLTSQPLTGVDAENFVEIQDQTIVSRVDVPWVPGYRN